MASSTNPNGAGRPRKAPGKKGRASKTTPPALGQIAQQVDKDLEGVEGISSSNALKVRWSRFAEAYFELGNATEAYKQAGYMPTTEQAAHSGASRLLSHPFVQAYLQRLHLMSVPETDINEPVREEDKEILVATEDEIVIFMTAAMRDTSLPLSRRMEAAKELAKLKGMYYEKIEISSPADNEKKIRELLGVDED